MKLSVVIPVFNERNTVAVILRRINNIPVDKELIVVDDFSTDGTREVLAKCLKEHSNLTVLHHDRNRGKGCALRTGFAVARGQYVIVQDADLEYDPEDYTKLLGPLERHLADAVYGSRFIKAREHRVLYFWHSVGNQFLTLLSNMMTNLNLTDVETCYKVFRRELIQAIPLEEDRFGFDPEVTCKLAKAGGADLRSGHRLSRPHLRRRQENRDEGRLSGALVHAEVPHQTTKTENKLAAEGKFCIDQLSALTTSKLLPARNTNT